jgi:hypothetical protein
MFHVNHFGTIGPRNRTNDRVENARKKFARTMRTRPLKQASGRGVLLAQKRVLSSPFLQILQNFPPMWIAGAGPDGAKIPSFLARPRATKGAVTN